MAKVLVLDGHRVRLVTHAHFHPMSDMAAAAAALGHHKDGQQSTAGESVVRTRAAGRGSVVASWMLPAVTCTDPLVLPWWWWLWWMMDRWAQAARASGGGG